jgi:hypothetical protein
VIPAPIPSIGFSSDSWTGDSFLGGKTGGIDFTGGAGSSFTRVALIALVAIVVIIKIKG